MRAYAMRTGWLVAVLSALACSGGGGSDGTGRAAITQNDAQEVAGAVVRGTVLSAEMPEVVGAGLSDDAGAARLGGSEPGRDLPLFQTRAPFGPTVVDCAISGTVTLSGDVDTPGTYAVGDQVVGDFMLCDDDTGYVFDGVLDLLVVALTGDLLGTDFDATLDLLMDMLVADDGVDEWSFDGDATLDWDLSVADLITIVLVGTRLDMELGDEGWTLMDYESGLQVDEAPSPDAYTFYADGRLTSSAFAGEVSYETTVDFQGTGQDPPETGQMVITGLNDATITIDPMGGDDVDLVLDLDGNGGPDVVVGTTWTELGF